MNNIRRKNLALLIREKYNDTQASFCRSSGLYTSEVSALLNGTRTFGDMKARQIEKIAMLPYEWLDQEHENVPTIGERSQTPIVPTVVPVLKIISNPKMPGGYYTEPIVCRAAFLEKMGVTQETGRFFWQHDWSMYPSIGNCSCVMVDTKKTELEDGKIFLLQINGEFYIRRLIHDYITGEYVWRTRCDNPDKITYPDKNLPIDPTMAVLGQVIWAERKFK